MPLAPLALNMGPARVLQTVGQQLPPARTGQQGAAIRAQGTGLHAPLGAARWRGNLSHQLQSAIAQQLDAGGADQCHMTC